MTGLEAMLLADKGLSPELLSGIFKDMFSPDKFVSMFREKLADSSTALSKDSLVDDFVRSRLEPMIRGELPASLTASNIPAGLGVPTDWPGTVTQDINLTGHPMDGLKKGDRCHVDVKIGGENELLEQFKPGGTIERQVDGRPDKTVILVSKDFRHLPMQEQKDIRDRMRIEKVVIVPDLPEKSILDAFYARADGQVESQKTEGKSKKKPMANGPEDKTFDQNKNKSLESRGEECHETAQRGKPTPDGTSVDDANKTKTYWEDKRPSECKDGGNSWLSTYHKKADGTGSDDPIAETRIKAKKDCDNGTITKAEAEARVIIAEHDDHYDKKNTRWKDPPGVPSEGYKDKLGIRLPDSDVNKDRVSALEKELKDAGRNPEVHRENGVVCIRYDVKS